MTLRREKDPIQLATMVIVPFIVVQPLYTVFISSWFETVMMSLISLRPGGKLQSEANESRELIT